MTAEYWRARLQTGKTTAYFQPIIATDTGQVYGHEALGRHVRTDHDGREVVESLGPFFAAHCGDGETAADREALSLLKRDTDRALRRDAIEKAAAHGGEGKIFLNISPTLMLGHLASGLSLPPSIRLARELGLDPRRVVLEITEEDIEVEPEELLRLVDLYRQEGFLVALDDVGSASSNLDRVGLFRPDIIKVDFRLLKRSADTATNAFRHILDGLSVLAERIGSGLLFEGIEGEADFRNALSYGARFLQGFLFSRAESGFSPASAFTENMAQHRKRYAVERYAIAIRRHCVEELLLATVKALDLGPLEAAEHHPETFADRLAATIAHAGDQTPRLERIYATDGEGIQRTPNFRVVRSHGRVEVAVEEEAQGRCWCFRPYFFNHVERSLSAPLSWTISQPYHDIAAGNPVRTLARDLDGDRILFLDFAAEEAEQSP